MISKVIKTKIKRTQFWKRNSRTKLYKIITVTYQLIVPIILSKSVCRQTHLNLVCINSVQPVISVIMIFFQIPQRIHEVHKLNLQIFRPILGVSGSHCSNK